MILLVRTSFTANQLKSKTNPFKPFDRVNAQISSTNRFRKLDGNNWAWVSVCRECLLKVKSKKKEQMTQHIQCWHKSNHVAVLLSRKQGKYITSSTRISKAAVLNRKTTEVNPYSNLFFDKLLPTFNQVESSERACFYWAEYFFPNFT